MNSVTQLVAMGNVGDKTSALETPRRTAAAQAQEAQRTTQDRLRVMQPAQRLGLVAFSVRSRDNASCSGPGSPNSSA
jgi:hypothetical protein